MRSLKRTFAHFLFVSLLAGTAIAGPVSGPIDPTVPIDSPPTTKPALPGMPSVEPIMIESRLGFMISTPIIAFDNTGVLTYSAATDVLSVDADALAILLNNVDPPGLIFPGINGADVLINIEVDNMGNLIGGTPGDDLVVTGAVDLTGDFIPDIDGVLLTGEITEYMGEDSGGTTDFHAFRFTVTGGLLAGPFGNDIAIELTSEMSDFTENYNVDFSGEAKGNIGVVECTGTIGDFVWLDLDGNGIQDAGEAGIGGVQVVLRDVFGNVIDTETTLANGFYQFSNLCAGTYTVSVNPDSLPPDVAPTLINAPGSNDDNDSNDADGTTVTLPNNNSDDDSIDFGYVPVTSALGDYVWEDLNMDGIQDANEPPVEGVMVNLYNCEGEFLDSTVTDAFGFYQFTNLPSGCYQVEFILPDGFVFTLMDQNGEALDSDPDPTTGFTNPVFLAPGETNPDVDAGIFRPDSAELGDRFWEDLNGNGIQDPGEPGIEGVTVNLYDCAGNLLDSTTTDANGMYLFAPLPAGCYVVGFEPPAQCILTAQDAGLNDADDSDADPVTGLTGPIDLADMESDLTWDAGCYYTAGLGDFVWNDLNQNGIQDAGEPGIPDLLVVLLDADMMPTGLTTTTGANGEYEFTGLPPGSYFVQFTSPPGFVYTAQDAGADDVDSDANGTGKTDKITLESGEFDPTIDAGVYVPDNPSISIEKSTNGFDADVPTGPFIPNGDPVLWEYFVENTGNVTLTNVLVTDDQGVLVSCPQTTLTPGETMTCTGMGDATVDQYENLGTVSGDPPQGPPETDEDPSHYFGADPSIDIEKLTNGEDADLPTGPYITPGGAVSWSYVVQNTGNVTLTDVTVTDDQNVTVTCPLDELAPDQIMTCTASGVAVIGQYANLGTVTGNPPPGAGDPVDDEDPSHYFGAVPGIDIEKSTNGFDADTPTGPFIAVGGNVIWTYLVTNTGNVELTNVTVTDDQGVVVDCGGQTTLAPAGQPGDSFICNAIGIAAPDQYQNIGTVVGDPPPGVGPPQTDTDPSHYFGARPEIDLEKLTNGEDADNPTGPVVAVGSTVTWTYVITNMGNVTLSNISLNDSVLGPIACNEGPIPTLNPGNNFLCTVMGIATAGQYMNLGDTCGTDPTGVEVCDDDPSHYLGADPSIDIEKATNGEDADNPTGPFIETGGAVTWTYVVTNTGNVDLTNVVVTDDQGVAVDCGGQNTLAANGGTFTCMANGTALAGQYANIGSVVGTPPAGAGDPVSDSDPSHYFGTAPSIDIEKATNGEDADNPTGPFIETGGAVNWTYVVTNTGNVDLTNVVVTDDQGVAVDCGGQNTLAANGGTFTCMANGTALAGQYANIGSVVGTPPAGAGDPVTDSDPSHYFGTNPSIDIEKATNGEDADNPTGPFIVTGGAVNWTYIVTNTGNVPLVNVVVTDDQGVAVDCGGQNTLAANGGTFTCTATGTAQAGQYANIGDVVGTPPVGGPVTDRDPSHYFGVTPGIDIEKATNGEDADNPTGPSIEVGNPVIWTYVVTNTSNVALTAVTVTDDQGVVVDCGGQNTLAPAGQAGDSFTCTATGVATLGQYANIGSVSGTPPVGPPVDDSDPSHYIGVDLTEMCVLAAIPNPVYSTSGSDHAFTLPGIDTHTEFLPDAGSFVENVGAGTAVLSGRLGNRTNPANGFDVVVNLTGATNVAPPGSPKRELRDSAYSENGGPVDTSTFRYYTGFSGTLVGFGAYAGSVINITPTGPAFQLGFGANNKNINFGASAWFDWVVVSQPNNGHFPSTGLGDINVDIKEDCTPPECVPGDFADHFGSDSFSNNDGSLNWSGPWIEDDVAGTGPGAGNAKVWGGYLILDDSPDTGTDPSLAREADLSQFTSATLTFDFWTSSFVDDTDAVTLEISNDGGVTYQTLEVFTGIDGALDDSRSYDISGFISSQTRIRFRVSNLYGGDKETFKVDNLRIDGSCEPPPPPCTPGDFADHFGGDRFTNNDGSLDWNGSWIEDDAAGTGPGAGNAKVWGGYLILDDAPDTGTDPSLAREADLSQFLSATLSFDFWTSSFVDTTDAVTVEISNDGGATYQTLEVFTNIDGASDGWRSYDISGFISEQTRVRFRVSNLYGGDKETFKVDNLRIEGDCN